jgi:hypothetical protein
MLIDIHDVLLDHRNDYNYYRSNVESKPTVLNPTPLALAQVESRGGFVQRGNYSPRRPNLK